MKFSVYEVPFSIKLILRTFVYVTIGYCIVSFNSRLKLKTNAIIYNIENITFTNLKQPCVTIMQKNNARS